MFWTELFGIKRVCQHEKIRPDLDSAYCPDCGKLIRNEWYIARCACCGIKLKAMSKQGEIVAQDHYCINCGSDEYVIEKIPRINFIDINYAVLRRKEVDQCVTETPLTTQCWQEKTVLKPKLLAQYL